MTRKAFEKKLIIKLLQNPLTEKIGVYIIFNKQAHLVSVIEDNYFNSFYLVNQIEKFKKQLEEKGII